MAYNTIRIYQGPSREALFDALRLRHEHRQVEFNLATGASCKATINSIAVESGDGQSWYGEGKDHFGRKFKYYFNTARRDGSITFIGR